MTVVDPVPSAAFRHAEREVVSELPALGPRAELANPRDVAQELVGDLSIRLDVQSMPEAGRPVAGRVPVKWLGRVRAWMVVPVVDFLMLMAPLAWRPPQPLTILTMAVLGTLLLSGGGRYVAPLHLSVMDELPSILTRLLAAVAAVAAIVLNLHEKSNVQTFLETACQAVALVILGRLATTRLVGMGRRWGIAKHHTVLIGGGRTAAELARTLADHREYGLVPVGFVDDGDYSPAAELIPRLGRLADLDMAVITTGADTILVADGDFDERALIDAVRTKVVLTAELLVVPRLHHFHTLTGTADHIGSIPIMRIRNPNLRVR